MKKFTLPNPTHKFRSFLLVLLLLGMAGITSAQPGIGTGGNITQVNIDGTWYVVHTFTGSGTFTPPAGVNTGGCTW
jgi:hypothetical protein